MDNNPDIDFGLEVKVLNQLFAAQTMLHIFPDETKMGEFITQALISIPGIEACFFCSRNSECKPKKPMQEIISISEHIKNIPDAQDHFSISKPLNENLILFPLQTTKRTFGIVSVLIQNADHFKHFKLSINNFINVIALDLENRWQKTLLAQHQFHLEELIEKRTAELQEEITERKLAEQELQKSERYLKEAQKIGKLGFWDLNVATGALEWSDESFVMYGFEPQEFVPTFQKFEEMVFPGDIERVQQNVDAALKGVSMYDIDFRFVRPDGRIAWIHCEGKVSFDEKGKATRFFGIQIDITERKLVETQLRDEKEQKRIILEMVGNPIFLKDNDHRMIFANSAFCDIFGLDEKHVIGKTLAENVPENEREQFLKIDRNVLDTGIADLREEELTVGGFTNTIITQKTRFTDESGNRFLVGSIHDITERKQAENAVRESEAELREAQRIGHLGSWYLNIANNEVVWTEELYQMYNFDSKLPPPPYTEHQKLFTPDSWQKLSKAIPKTSETGIPYELELETVRKDGSNGWMWVRGEQVKDGKGAIVGLRGVAQDITERKQAEEAFLESENLLNATQQLTKVGGWKWNIKTQSMFWTDETYHIHEIDPKEIETGSNGHIELGAKCYTEKDRQIVMTSFQKCADEGISYDLEFPFTTVKGNKIWVRTTARAEKENDKVVSVIGNLMDITERKKAEDEIRKFNEELEQLVKERTKEIDDKNKALERINKLFVGRELRMKELKEEIEKLKKELEN